MSHKEDFQSRYQYLAPLYARLGVSLVAAIETFLQQSEISIVDITHRIKSAESAAEKSNRKNYSNPIVQIEDWCGIRIICYYSSDVEKICKILREEFDIIGEENTENRLKPQEFGYRSTHLIVSIKDSWLQAPQYRGLHKMKAEVQIRTILMHAWAEIEHKLAYKSSEQAPNNFKRKLYRLSAKFEEADEQFEELKNNLTQYRETILKNTQQNLDAFRDQELNLETFQLLLDTAYPSRKRLIEKSAALLAEVLPLELSMTDLVDAIEAQVSVISKMEGLDAESRWAQVGAMRNALDISNDKYYTHRRDSLLRHQGSEWRQKVLIGRKALGKIE